MNILEMSVYGGIMILAVVVLRALTVHRLPKGTFVALWLLVLARLLIPFTIPSPASIYTFVGEHAPITLSTPRPEATAPAPGQGNVPVGGNVALPVATAPAGSVSPVTVPTVPTDPVPAPPPAPAVPVWTLVWMGGLMVCGLFFLFVYLKNQREFRMSLPVENDFLTVWLESHPLRRRIQVRQYDRITAPLTYGLLRPVILLPADTDWEDERALSYVLEHELIHIKRWDSLTKLLLAAAVCVHWFNPLVWVMFFLANRDLELFCDEGVLRRFGTGQRGNYARTLIGMEETRGGMTPIYNHFSKGALEERVVAIMKTKKLTLAAVIAAVILVMAVAVMFATSPREEQTVDTTPTPIPTETVPAVTDPAESEDQEIPVELSQLAGKYHFLSGAGGWETVLTVNSDGTFHGQYHDSEMGEYDPVKYPNGTIYYCSFSGSFQNLRREDNYTWTMEVETLNYPTVGRVLFGEEASETIQGPNGEELVLWARSEQGDLWYMPKEEGVMPYMWKFDGGTRYITSTPYGLDEAKEITVYLPGTPVSNLPQEALSWLTSAPGFWDPENLPETLPFTVLYNVAEGEAFFRDDGLTLGGGTPSGTVDPEAQRYLDLFLNDSGFPTLVSIQAAERDPVEDAPAAYALAVLDSRGELDHQLGVPAEELDRIVRKYFGYSLRSYDTPWSKVLPSGNVVPTTDLDTGLVLYPILSGTPDVDDLGYINAEFKLYALDGESVSDRAREDLLTGNDSGYPTPKTLHICFRIETEEIDGTQREYPVYDSLYYTRIWWETDFSE